jgi:alkanesulfonate monooxygenase SsuD/methylene tetrahydromethanopterin reductase-like flavin-dependent oxidoreductase (luciferase family)
MDVGIGLPTTIRGVPRRTVLDWARRSEEAGFSSLGTIDRIVYGNWESLIGLAAAGAVTERIGLVTQILIAPLRSSTALLAKQAATLDTLSEGRLTLGLAVGGRQDDFAASGVDFHRRGRLFEAQLDELRRIWGGESRGTAGAIGPGVGRGRPRVLVGGTSPPAFRRAATYGDGWTSGGGGPPAFAQGAAAARDAWRAAGREGAPNQQALAYNALGPDAVANANGYLRDYYGFLPEQYQDMIVGGAATSEERVREYRAAFEEAGCDELILFPCAPDVAQVDLLAAAVLE